MQSISTPVFSVTWSFYSNPLSIFLLLKMFNFMSYRRKEIIQGEWCQNLNVCVNFPFKC